MEQSFHVSHAVLQLSTDIPPDFGLEVHVILHNIDYIVCILSRSAPQTPLNLEISEGEEMTVYACAISRTPHSESVSVHLTGYYCLEQSQGDEESYSGEEEDLVSEEEYGEVSQSN